ncbi:Hypothetical predicted protein [Pelobates cultripes]|uniref:Uncharacterized protein n=1 Tax=Pelobates cultripes TaxID=61616 RepID=A0AAD1TMG3_PELCU|nr:Hypothetical predicted protein [Pelobates cultripes]
MVHHCAIASKTQETAYKILSWWYVTPDHLQKMNPELDGKYWRCHGSPGSFLHIWWECPIITRFWSRVASIVSQFTDKPLPYHPATPSTPHNHTHISIQTIFDYTHSLSSQKSHTSALENGHNDTNVNLVRKDGGTEDIGGLVVHRAVQDTDIYRHLDTMAHHSPDPRISRPTHQGTCRNVRLAQSNWFAGQHRPMNLGGKEPWHTRSGKLGTASPHPPPLFFPLSPPPLHHITMPPPRSFLISTHPRSIQFRNWLACTIDPTRLKPIHKTHKRGGRGHNPDHAYHE